MSTKHLKLTTIACIMFAWSDNNMSPCINNFVCNFSAYSANPVHGKEKRKNMRIQLLCMLIMLFQIVSYVNLSFCFGCKNFIGWILGRNHKYSSRYYSWFPHLLKIGLTSFQTSPWCITENLTHFPCSSWGCKHQRIVEWGSWWNGREAAVRF